MSKYKKYIFGILTVLIWLLVLFLSSEKYKKWVYKQEGNKIEQTINRQIDFCIQQKQMDVDALKKFHRNNENVNFFVKENNQYTFWTSNAIPLDSVEKFNSSKLLQIARLRNGWYIVVRKKMEDKTIVGFILLKNVYPYQNPHLQNRFPAVFDITQQYSLSLNKPEDKFSQPLHIEATNQEVYLIPSDAGFIYPGWSVILGIVAVLMAYFMVHWLFTMVFPPTLVYLMFEILLLLLLRLWFQLAQIPALLYQHELFSPKYFAVSDWLPSLGDLILSVLTILMITRLVMRLPVKVNPFFRNVSFLAVKQSLVAGIVILTYHLIYNSTLHFNLNDMYELSWYSIFALSCVLILMGIYFVVVTWWSKNNFSTRLMQLSIALQIITYFVISLYLENTFYWFLSLTIFEALLYIYRNSKMNLSAYFPLITIMIFAFGISITIVKMSEAEEHDERKFLAEKLINDKDPIAEYLFIDIEKKIKADKKLIKRLHTYWENKEQVDEYLLKKYFTGYWSKYDITFVECHAGDSIVIEEENKEVLCESFFKSRIEQSADYYLSTNAPIYFVNDENGVIYIADIVLPDENNIAHHIYIEFYYKYFPKTEGYPELLLSEKQLKQIVKMGNYSYAKYKNGILINKLGDFDYYTKLDTTYINAHHQTFYNEDGYNHYLYNSAKNTVVLSLPQISMIEKMSVFSYVFILIGILFITGYFLFLPRFSLQSFTLQSFNTKIQFFVITNIFIAFTLIAIGTVYYIRYQYTEKNITNISEKIQSVMVEVEHKLGEADTLNTQQKELMNYYLVKFSNVFYTDINLYQTNGKLFATSRPEVFLNGLLNEFMPYDVYEALTVKHKSEYIHQESIGNLKYLSAYVPFRNYKNKVLAYLNLPYFAKQHALEEELANFYVALINIYVLVFVLSIILAVVFANYLSAPLRLIKSTISKLQIGKTNELIEWQTNDEIGELIKEYNKKVIELEKSARLLAKSERESAWREMAKQVAHEIKNPLTPMKLSIQHLQRITTGIDGSVKEKIDKTASVLIEQIDTLATIATEFSNFAKLPEPQLEKVDIIKIVQDCSLLFDKQKAQITVKNNTSKQALYVRADKDQMIRIFNNLIKNAIQSVRPEKIPEIEIEISEQNDEVVIAVKDNGEGISAEQQSKIFEPNFTTKTGGMGLGLAMVKNFVETFNGKIWFTSTIGKGTVFYLSFPAIKNHP